MSVPLVDDVPEEVPVADVYPAPRVRPTWAVRLGVAAAMFIGAGSFIIIAALLANPLHNADVLSAGVTLVAAGAVLRSITSDTTSATDN